MKKLFFNLTMLVIFAAIISFSSCSKDEISKEDFIKTSEVKKSDNTISEPLNLRSQILDYIEVDDNQGNNLNSFIYDVTNGKWIGDNIPTGAGGAVTILGTLKSKEPNNNGGHNYKCTSSQSTCYTND